MNKPFFNDSFTMTIEINSPAGQTRSHRKTVDKTKPAKYTMIVVDIEGTITPISFVRDTLFPYLRNNLNSFLKIRWESDACQNCIRSLVEQSQNDSEEFPGFAPITDCTIESISRYIIAQMDVDRKIAALKEFQGYMWAHAFKSKEIIGVLFDDIFPTFRKWKQEYGIVLSTYSSGSIAAQKLLLTHSNFGDLGGTIDHIFDTTIGLKKESSSYTKILKKCNHRAGDVLFISDNVEELAAARDAGMHILLMIRPGNDPVEQDTFDSATDISSLNVGC